MDTQATRPAERKYFNATEIIDKPMAIACSRNEKPNNNTSKKKHLISPRPSLSTAPASYGGSDSGSPSLAHPMSSCAPKSHFEDKVGDDDLCAVMFSNPSMQSQHGAPSREGSNTPDTVR